MCSSTGGVNQAVSVAGQAWLTITADAGCRPYFLLLFISDIGEGELLVKFDGPLPTMFTNGEWITKLSYEASSGPTTVQIARGRSPGWSIWHALKVHALWAR